MNKAKKERAQIFRNTESAYRTGEINAVQLLWIRIITAKYLLKAHEIIARHPAGGSET